jgi:hypothetical protein
MAVGYETYKDMVDGKQRTLIRIDAENTDIVHTIFKPASIEIATQGSGSKQVDW